MLFRSCWLALDLNCERVIVFFVPEGGDYATHAYWYDIVQNSWSKADYTSKFATGGITAAATIAGSVMSTPWCSS